MSSKNNLELFSLVWLGDLIEQDIQEQIRAIYHQFVIFNDENQCLEYLQNLNRFNRILVVIKSKFGPQIIPQIIDFVQIIAIYVYTNEKKTTELWTKNFKKIRGVYLRYDELIQQIQIDQQKREFYQINDILPYDLFNSKCPNEQCLFSQILIKCLISSKIYPKNRLDFLQFCKQYYRTNSFELKLIDEFEKDYSTDKALWWLTRSTFLSHLLKQSLQTKHLQLLLFLRFFIRDIKQQIDKHKSSSIHFLYRSQLMYKEDLELFTKYTGNFISINTFFSTSTNREQIRTYLTSINSFETMEKVLFEINTNSPSHQNFSHITSLNSTNRDEYLFQIGSIFRLIHIEKDLDGIWTIQLSLSSNKDHQLQTNLKQKLHQWDISYSDPFSIGFCFEEINQFDQAEQFYLFLLEQIPNDHNDLSRCYHALGEIRQKKDDFDSSLEWYKKSLNTDEINLPLTYNSLGVVYTKITEYNLALESYEKALEILRKYFQEENLDFAMCYNNIGIVYQQVKNYSEALEYYHRAWNIRQKYLPINHLNLGQSHACIGNVHYSLQHYELALEHFNLAFEIFSQIYPANHRNIALIYRNIGLVYQNKNDLSQAAIYFEKCARIYRTLLPSTHSDRIQIEKILQRLPSN